ncbi:conserved hypothetical protein [Phenylobacterium zucineum HLK1]|uniref:DUF3667 domain-containing protein n=1 Tax=Phenylobacterium zucineum (strain HLK1) TaxID=450851 RepID=B4R7Z0_PHEZH|nr:DUF3667 domain-containing protein [Phenylobacterium zucineum]ACG77523.1 conserved hypothetical protein [Phenylobacterium zucineum HLK1]
MVDVDAAGAVAGAVHGGGLGSAAQRPAGQAGEAQHVCADCGAEVEGRFCANCGQAAHLHRTLAHLGEEVLHGVMHFDSRFWRTVPLLAFRPGRLTREWVHGRRTRYVSPLAMFLFTMFVLFMGLSYFPVDAADNVVGQQALATADLARKNTELANAEVALDNASPEERAAAQARVDRARAAAEAAGEQIGNVTGEGRVKTNVRTVFDEDIGEAVNTGNKKLDEKIRHKLENPELALYKLQQAFYKFSFLLIPISIPFVASLFLWKRGFTLYDHGVFVLYSLTFISWLVMALAIGTRIGGIVSALLWLTLPFAIPAHMYFQLKGAYGLGTFSALWRTWFLLWFCTFALLLFTMAVTLLSA